MTKRIFRSICLVSFAVAISCVILIAGGLYSYFTKQQQSSIRILTEMAAEATESLGIDYFDKLELSGNRITWVDNKGTVLYDTLLNPEEMANHLEREEIKEALINGRGESIRYSDSLTEYWFYYALKLSDGTVLRISSAESTVLMLIAEFSVPLIIIFLLILLLSFVLAFRLSKSIVKPLNDLDLDSPLKNDYYIEIRPLLLRIASQQRKLFRQEDKLLKRQREFDAVTEGMSEGLVLVNGTGVILSINNAAIKLIGLRGETKGKDFISLLMHEDIKETVRKGLFGNASESEVYIGDNIYSIKADPVFSENHITGAIILILDITAKKENEIRRREFTANVSHELKSPLHSISGYAELIREGIVKDSDVAEFGERIYSESHRLLNLVDDILRLSRLDEGKTDDKREFTNVDVSSLIREVFKNLSYQSSMNEVSTEFKGENIIVNSSYTLCFDIFKNLIDNAIKYNKKGGSVTVDAYIKDNVPVVTVSDSGIGISDAHKERIFERFYRVDKSHSREIGGTGLGLSIVKHSVMLIGGTVELESKEGVGTKITVIFPKESILQ